MSQRTRRPPFHRRILPWIFVLTFAFAAPALVLYTAGYRWNPKKQKIERNGTVIFDSTPTGASIWIDGRLTEDKTPVTLQDMPPGFHRFRMELPGSHVWEKTLEVKAEHVTFANDVWLWKNAPPTELLDESVRHVTVSSDERMSVFLTSASPTVAVITDDLLGGTSRLSFASDLPEELDLIWSPNSRNLLISSPIGQRNWLIDTRATASPVELPNARYRWIDGNLVGITENERFDYNVTSASLAKTVLPIGTTDQFDTATLRNVTGTSDIVLVSEDRPDTGLLLPRGNWSFWGELAGQELFRDGFHWMSLNRGQDPPEFHLAKGDLLRTIVRNRETLSLLVNGTEIWIWNPEEDPQLIYRQSETITDAVWHEAGVNIFFATKTQVFALSLDPRDGFLMTTLAEFEQIEDLAYRENQLLVSGVKDGRDRVWVIDLE
jgi:hypothetical protein